MNKIKEKISELSKMKKYPSELFFEGNLELLQKTKISIVGARKPSKYSRELTYRLASSLSKRGVCIVSGGAMGIDAVAHLGATSSNTIAVLPCGINIKYPAVNKNLLSDLQKSGLLLSQFDSGFRATPWSFVLRNELVVALGDILIVSEAEIDSGSMRSVEFALKMGKKIFVFPQRVGESRATNILLKEGKAEAIYDIEEFCFRFGTLEAENIEEDEFLKFCRTNPTYDDTLKKFPERIFEAELNGEVDIKNGQIFIL
jgi:DNA processing protein